MYYYIKEELCPHVLTSLYIICFAFKASNTLQLHRKLVSFGAFALLHALRCSLHTHCSPT